MGDWGGECHRACPPAGRLRAAQRTGRQFPPGRWDSVSQDGAATFWKPNTGQTSSFSIKRGGWCRQGKLIIRGCGLFIQESSQSNLWSEFCPISTGPPGPGHRIAHRSLVPALLEQESLCDGTHINPPSEEASSYFHVIHLHVCVCAQPCPVCI